MESSLAGPKRPQDRVSIVDYRAATEQAIQQAGKQQQVDQRFPIR